MSKVLKRVAPDVWSPTDIPISKRRKTSVVRTHQSAEEYSDDILRHMEYREYETTPDINRIPTEIQRMRPQTIQLLIVAHEALSLLPQTLFLSVNLIDRFCCRQGFHGQAYYELVGCVALWIASKYIEEKERVPHISSLMLFVPEGYYRQERLVLRLEMWILTVLEWRVGHPTPHCFIQLLKVGGRNEREIRESAANLCKIRLVDCRYLGTRPSVLARDCLLLASNSSLNTGDLP